MTTMFLGDWSNHDHQRGDMDFAAMRRDGVFGGSHKTTDGLRYYLDPYAAGALPRMRAAFADGLYGSYHVLWGNRDLAGQVDWWFAVLDDAVPGWRDDPRFFVMTDNEVFGYNQAPSIGQVNQTGDLIRARVPKTMVAYCPLWHYGSALADLRYPLVSSNYGTNPAVHYPDAYPGDDSARWMAAGGRAWALQYGSRTVMGSQNTCDANAVLDTVSGTLAALSPDGDDMSTEAEDTLRALREGTEHAAGAEFAPWLWEVARQKWQAEVSAKLAADEVRDKALSAALAALAKALAVGGGSVDVAAIMQRVDAAAADVKALVEQRHIEELAAYREQYEKTIAGLRAQLAALSQA